jgi:hypothetical protein
MRDVAGAFNDKTTSWRAGGFAVHAHAIESSLYGHRLALACLPRLLRAAQMTLRHLGFVA